MKFTLLILLVVAACAQASPVEVDEVLTSTYGYLERSLEYAEQKRKAEEEFLVNQRIIGGVPAALGQYPWQVSIVKQTKTANYFNLEILTIQNLRLTRCKNCFILNIFI